MRRVEALDGTQCVAKLSPASIAIITILLPITIFERVALGEKTQDVWLH
jgi:hypothetical protein